MTVPIFYVPTVRQRLSVLLADGNTVADYRAGIGQTDDGAGLCSSWANQIGIAGALTAAGAARPTIQADGSLLFDGVANTMASGAFTLNQPETIYLVVKQIAWGAALGLFDGATNSTMEILQDDLGASPSIGIFAGLRVRPNTDLALGVYGIVTAVFNGASSSIQVNLNAAVTGDAGAVNGGGITLGSRGDGLQPSNIQVKEAIVRNVADIAATRALILGYLKSIYGTP